MTRILSLDIGSKNLGIAITDNLQQFVYPIERICLEKFDAKLFFSLLKKKLEKFWDEIDSVIIGNSQDSEYSNNDKIVNYQNQFKRVISAYTMWKIFEEYEDFSSVESFSILKKLNFSKKQIKKNIDSYSAMVLLCNYCYFCNKKLILSY